MHGGEVSKMPVKRLQVSMWHSFLRENGLGSTRGGRGKRVCASYWKQLDLIAGALFLHRCAAFCSPPNSHLCYSQGDLFMRWGMLAFKAGSGAICGSWWPMHSGTGENFKEEILSSKAASENCLIQVILLIRRITWDLTLVLSPLQWAAGLGPTQVSPAPPKPSPCKEMFPLQGKIK